MHLKNEQKSGIRPLFYSFSEQFLPNPYIHILVVDNVINCRA